MKLHRVAVSALLVVFAGCAQTSATDTATSPRPTVTLSGVDAADAMMKADAMVVFAQTVGGLKAGDGKILQLPGSETKPALLAKNVTQANSSIPLMGREDEISEYILAPLDTTRTSTVPETVLCVGVSRTGKELGSQKSWVIWLNTAGKSSVLSPGITTCAAAELLAKSQTTEGSWDGDKNQFSEWVSTTNPEQLTKFGVEIAKNPIEMLQNLAGDNTGKGAKT